MFYSSSNTINIWGGCGTFLFKFHLGLQILDALIFASPFPHHSLVSQSLMPRRVWQQVFIVGLLVFKTRYLPELAEFYV